MKTIIYVFACLLYFSSAYSQKIPIVTDRPIVFDRFTQESNFLESSYEYYEDVIKDIHSDVEVKYFGYYSLFQNSPLKAYLESDTIELIISLKPGADFSNYNLCIVKLCYNAQKNRREALVGIKHGFRLLFQPLTAVKPRIITLDDNVFAIRIGAKPGDEFGLFFGSVRDGVPTNKMYCVSAVAAPKNGLVSAK
jgi:hypothetical protein